MTDAPQLKVLVLANDLSDAAIHRRVLMLRAGGAEVVVAGFRRTKEPILDVEGCRPINFGQSYNANFVQRAFLVMQTALLLHRHKDLFFHVDVILARNLEMLAIGVRGQSLSGLCPTLVYEVLDIHRLLLGRGVISKGLRFLEGWLSRRASLVLTSSEAFIENYFKAKSRVRLPTKLVENKVLAFHTGQKQSKKSMGPPWVIGWFGIIRCRESLKFLCDLVRRSEGKVEVVIRGRLAPDQFGDFYDTIADIPGIKFLGAYKSPDDLESMYGGVHFSWTIDHFEKGMNSAWLLPNRLYEGGLYGVVPIAESFVETGAFLRKRGLGVLIDGFDDEFLNKFFRDLTAQRYEILRKAVQNVSFETWVDNESNCRTFVNDLITLHKSAFRR